jgi:tRNA(His) guanylyltransferase
MKDPLGDRMKQYEAATRLVLPRRTYTVVRVDGKAFHTFLRHTDKPWDDDVVMCMQVTAQRLCKVLDGALLAYTQSDEISVVLQDFENNGTQAWFGGVVQKMASVGAAYATAFFTQEYRHHFDLEENDLLPVFDSRVFTIPDVVEVANYLIWRQRDTIRNSIQALGHAHFGPRWMHSVDTERVREALRNVKGIEWERDVPQGLRQGWLVQKVQEGEGEEMRSRWDVDAAPEFKADGSGILAQLLPGPRLLS